MSANLDRPLSDIIDENNKSNPRRGGRGGARRGGAGGQRRSNNNNANNKNSGGAFRNPLARDDEAAAEEDQNGGGGYGPQRRGRMDNRAGPYGDDSWKHDMYGSGGPRQIQRPSGVGFKLLVSNLDNAVTNSDLQEIFAEIGPIAQALLNTDKEGRPIGTAEITFGSRAEAERALKEFDGAEVDGRPMYLKLVSAPPRVQSVQAAAPAPRQNNNFSVGPRPQRGGGLRQSRGGNTQSRPRGGSAGRGRGGAGGGRGGRGGRTRQPKEAVTAESLDAEMENYRKSAASGGEAAAPAASS